jgi:SAM-dependent methyltransferase
MYLMEWFRDLYNRQIYFDLYAKGDTRLAIQEVDGIVDLLGLEPGRRVLDVCCGYGRHAIELARRGQRVTGVDLSPVQIEAARENARAAGVEIGFVVGDAREMGYRDQFDVTLNLFTSFGFFEEGADDLQMLASIARASAPGGQFLLDLWNREKQIRDFSPFEIEERADGVRIEKRWAFDAWRGRLNWSNHVTFPDGREERWEHSVRAYTLVELRQMLEGVGFELERVYGAFDGRAYTLDAPQMVLVARKRRA